MSAKKFESDRRRSRPVTKRIKASSLKRNKPAMVLVIIIVAMLVFSSAYVIFSSLGDSNGSDADASGYENDPEYIAALAGTDYPVAVINTSKGVIAVELYNDKVPDTCENFITLVNDGFYEGLVFHRVIDNFMIQGGGFKPDGSEKESPYGSIDLEIHPDVRHVDGAIAMARTSDPNSASSQFYICDGSQAGLDDNYAAFGKTIYGMDVVRNIASVDTTIKNGIADWPREDIFINSINIVNE